MNNITTSDIRQHGNYSDLENFVDHYQEYDNPFVEGYYDRGYLNALKNAKALKKAHRRFLARLEANDIDG